MPISGATRVEHEPESLDARTAAPTTPGHGAARVAIVLWRGDLGGAESVSAAIVGAWRRAGVDASIVFVTGGEPLSERLDADGVPHASAGLDRGRDAFLHPRRVAHVLAAVAPDGAFLADAGHLAAALRLGGYRGRLVGVEHGKVLAVAGLRPAARLKDRVERTLASPFRAVDVGVSDFLVGELRRRPHARTVARIPNGVDTDRFAPGSARAPVTDAPLAVGCAARLVPGKGVDRLLEAAARLPPRSVAVTVAGDGPERGLLEATARRLEVEDRVTFAGPVADMAGFWRACDVAVVPSDHFVESFSMTTLEAMACGIPVVATANGGVPEVLADGECGVIVPPGDVDAIARALVRYRDEPELRSAHGRAGARRAREQFSIADVAGRYLDVLTTGRA